MREFFFIGEAVKEGQRDVERRRLKNERLHDPAGQLKAFCEGGIEWDTRWTGWSHLFSGREYVTFSLSRPCRASARAWRPSVQRGIHVADQKGVGSMSFFFRSTPSSSRYSSERCISACLCSLRSMEFQWRLSFSSGVRGVAGS